MTHREFTEALITIGWSRAHVARQLDCDAKLVWFWSSGQLQVPVAVALWINRVVGAMARVPPPGEWRVQ